MNTRQLSAPPNPLLPPQPMPTMAYAQPSYTNRPISVAPPGTMYSVGGMPGGQQNMQYRVLTGAQLATAGHGGPIGSGPGVAVGAGRGGAMPMTTSGQPQGPGAGMPTRYGQQTMGIGRGVPNGIVTMGRMGIPGAGMAGGVPSLRMQYTPGMMNLPPGTRIVNAPAGMVAHPGQYAMLSQQGQHVIFAQMPQSQQHHGNPNGPGQSPAHMLIPQQQPPGGPLQQPPPLGGPGMAHPGAPGQKPYQQQPPFMGSMTSTPMGALPPLTSGGPVRNPSPNAAIPTNASTPGGPGAGRGMAKPPTPANASTPFTTANAPTPGSARPGTASGQQDPTSYLKQHTPRIQAAEANGVGLQSSPGVMQRNPSANLGTQQQQQPQQQLQSQQGQLSQPGGPPPQPGGPGGPTDHSSLYRATPAQIERERNAQIYGSGQGQGPMEGVRYGTVGIGPAPGQIPQQHQPRQGVVMAPPQPPQGMTGPLQSQLTGGSMSSQPGGPLVPQHTGGARPLAPQHTGGSMQDSAMNPPGGPMAAPGGRTSVPSTPQMASRQASISIGGGMLPPGNDPMLARSVAMPMYTFPMTTGGMAPPPPRGEGFRSLPIELGAVSASDMGAGGLVGVTASRHAFGVLRLLKFSSQMEKISGHDTERWLPILEENFTENATLTFRARKEVKQHANTFVTLPFPLLHRFFATLTQSNITRMSLILDGAIESQEGHEYIVYCSTARWPMHYDSGWIMELNGVLKARCKTVPINMVASEAGNPAVSGAPNRTPRTSATMPAGPNANGSSSSPSSSNNMHASPTNRPSIVGSFSNGSEPKSFMPLSGAPYMVKIDELSFDSISVSKFFSIDPRSSAMTIQLPKEPDTKYGIPEVTMRVVEFAECALALGNLMDFTVKMQSNNPIKSFEEYGNILEGKAGAFPPTLPPDEQFTFARLPGQQGTVWVQRKEVIAATNDALANEAEGALMGYDDMPSGNSPSTLSANVNQRMGDLNESQSSSSDPTVSPSAAPKTPGKKNTAPGSPTKAVAAEKDKGGGKRKNTNDVEGPPTKRRTRKGSKVT